MSAKKDLGDTMVSRTMRALLAHKDMCQVLHLLGIRHGRKALMEARKMLLRRFCPVCAKGFLPKGRQLYCGTRCAQKGRPPRYAYHHAYYLKKLKK